MIKRVLVTGGGGFAGAHLIMHLLHSTDWEIICIDSFRHKGKTDRLSDMLFNYPKYKPRLKILSHDLTVPFSEQFLARMGQVDYVVNMASLSHVDTSIQHPRDFVENNIALMLTILEYVRLNPVDKFIHISTDEVYGPAPLDYEHKEGDYHRPSNPYSASKAAQEDLGFSYWRTYGIPYIQTNCMNLFGEFQDPEKLVPRVIQCAVKGETMPIFANKDKTAAGSRKFLHARNQADATLFVLNNVKPVKYEDGTDTPPVFNVVGDDELTNLEMALLVASFTGKELKYEMVDVHTHRPGHDLRYALDGTKLAELGWKAPVPFESTVKSTVKWTMRNPIWML